MLTIIIHRGQKYPGADPTIRPWGGKISSTILSGLTVQQCHEYSVLGLHSSSVIDLICVLDAAYDSPTTSHPRHGSPWSGEFGVTVSDDFQALCTC